MTIPKYIDFCQNILIFVKTTVSFFSLSLKYFHYGNKFLIEKVLEKLIKHFSFD